jgi:hypothetical protein
MLLDCELSKHCHEKVTIPKTSNAKHADVTWRLWMETQHKKKARNDEKDDFCIADDNNNSLTRQRSVCPNQSVVPMNLDPTSAIHSPNSGNESSGMDDEIMFLVDLACAPLPAA